MTVENIGTELRQLRYVVYGAVIGLAVIAIGVIVGGSVLQHQQDIGAARADKQRQAICAILANIPGHVPPEIQKARQVFARTGHPRDCKPLPKATPTPSGAKAGSSPGAASPTVVVVPSGVGGVSASPRPASHPAPTSTPKPHPTGTPNPTPSPTCNLRDLIRDPIHCLHL